MDPKMLRAVHVPAQTRVLKSEIQNRLWAQKQTTP